MDYHDHSQFIVRQFSDLVGCVTLNLQLSAFSSSSAVVF